jgi:hypothetical protein
VVADGEGIGRDLGMHVEVLEGVISCAALEVLVEFGPNPAVAVVI